MGKERAYRYFSCDFETTVYAGQERTDVWAAAAVELFTEDVFIAGSIEGLFDYLVSLKSNIIAYFHNLKFDGSFWLNFLLQNEKYKLAINQWGDSIYAVNWDNPKKMTNNTYQYSISDRGQWYSIKIKTNNYMIEIRDSLKLLPFTVREIGKAFKTKHQKLDMEYKGFRYPNCYISSEERDYIANDVLVVKEALEALFKQGHKKISIGSCCLAEYKKIIGAKEYNELYPDLYNIPLQKQHTYKTAGEWLRKAYRGGWCYLVKDRAGKIIKNGVTADVNSLYPSMMHSESGNRYPYGLPRFWTGNYIPDEAIGEDKFYYVRVKTRFYLKKGMLPTVQIKGSWLYKGTEQLESSDYIDAKTGERSAFYIDFDGNVVDTRQELTMTMMDYEQLKRHYNLIDFEILDGCWFYAKTGLFDKYIDKYKEIKAHSTGALRTLAKLFLNNLYGKMAASEDSSFKVAYLKEDGSLGFYGVPESEKTPGYIAVGAAITSYARCFTIAAAQDNYRPGGRGFIYADTDSCHMDLRPDEIKGIPVHPSDFCKWKLESYWDEAVFIRQKTYAEYITHENGEPVDKSFWNIKCAGMPEVCKQLFAESMKDEPIGEKEKEEFLKQRKELANTPEKAEFLKTKRTIKDFNYGLIVPGKLMPKQIPGGILLKEGFYEIRK